MTRQQIGITILGALIAGLFIAVTWYNLSPPPPQVDFSQPIVEVVVDGLLAPIGMAVMVDGGLLVAESGTGENDGSAGVSLVLPTGEVGRLLSGLESTRDSGDLAGAPLVTVAPEGDKIYIGNYNQNHLWILPLSPQQQVEGLPLPDQALTRDDLNPAMMPLNRVMLMNPFDIAFDEEGVPVVTDATGDGVAIETPDGMTRFFHRFARYPDPTANNEKVTLSPVPTGIARIGSEYYVTLTGGCPFPPGGGKLVAIDKDRNERVVLDRLNMPIDVAQAADGTIWVLEFATFAEDASCFNNQGYQARTGRLSRLMPDGSLDPVLSDLNFPGSVLPLADGSLYISEVYPGRVLRVRFGSSGSDEATPTPAGLPAHESSSTSRPTIDDYDRTLALAIERLGYTARPGAGEREEEGALSQLGQSLFFDPILSGDRNISCATCHHPSFAGADGRTLSIGTGGEGIGPERQFRDEVMLGPEAALPRRLAGTADPETGLTIVHNPFVGQFIPRNSPTIINAALFPSQFWDSRVQRVEDRVITLEEEINELELEDPLVTQALFPLISKNEMAGATLGDLPAMEIRNVLLERLRANPNYREAFTKAFGDGEITLPRLGQAIAAFERRFVFTDAPWDRYVSGDTGALTDQQKRGAALFLGYLEPKVNCAICHSGDLFSDFQHHNLLVPQLGPGKGHDYTGREDWGRAGFTFDLRDRYAFRTPSLRNVELTAPYFHDGAFSTLATAIRHLADIQASAERYDPSANAIPAAHYSSLRSYQPEKQLQTADPILIAGLPLRENDIEDLVAFLQALTDPTARDLSQHIPSVVLSGLPLDPLPSPATIETYREGVLAMAEPLVQASEVDRGLASEQESDLRFREVTTESGVDFQQGSFRTSLTEDPVAAMGGGLCWIDYDKDGWLDLYLVNSYSDGDIAYWQSQGGFPRNALYRNQEGIFSDASAGSGADFSVRGNGCLAADFDHDGWTDLYVTADGPNLLLWNNGDGTFTEGARAAGVDTEEWNSAAVAGDLNGDGWDDLVVLAYLDLEKRVPKPAGLFPQDYYGLPDHVYLNLGTANSGAPTSFREVTEIAGLVREERGLGALLADLDNDGDLDLYIANDGHPNRLYRNDPWPGGFDSDPEGLGFRFIDLTESAQVGDSGSGMGVAGGDYDGDGWLDLVVTNWERELNALYRNETADNESLEFQYSTFRIGMMGLGNNQTGWGVHWSDFDHDTDLDLLIVNGRVPVTNLHTDPQLVRFYRNITRNPDGAGEQLGQFRDASQVTGLGDVGPLLGRGSAAADYDNDGDIDLAINAISQSAMLLRNDRQQGRWLIVDVGGMIPGVRVVLELPDGKTLLREVAAGSSYLASEDPRMHFGLGQTTTLPSLQVRWPDGTTTILRDVSTNQILQVTRE